MTRNENIKLTTAAFLLASALMLNSCVKDVVDVFTNVTPSGNTGFEDAINLIADLTIQFTTDGNCQWNWGGFSRIRNRHLYPPKSPAGKPPSLRDFIRCRR